MNKSSLPYSVQDFPRLSQLQTGGSRDSLGEDRGNAFGPVENASTIKKIHKFFRRLIRPSTLDFETATWEMFHLIINPKKMYRSHYYKLQGWGSYTRDDPSFLVLLTGFLSLSAIAWGLAYSPSFWEILKLIVYVVIVDFHLVGVVIATISWLLVNKIVNNTYGMSSARYKVNYIDWGFCWDIHCNSFVVIWCLLYVIQFIMLPIISIKKSFLALLLGNTLYFGSIGYYFVVTFYGYNSHPLVSGGSGSKSLQNILLMGILPAYALAWLISICSRVNVAVWFIDKYFS